MLGERLDLVCDIAEILLAAFAARVVVLGGHQQAAGGQMIMRTRQIGHHEITLRVRQHQHEVKQAVRLTLHPMTGGLKLAGTRFPGLLAHQAAGEVLQGRMLLRTQEKHTAFGADVRIDVEGVNEGVESVGHEKEVRVPSAADAARRRRRASAAGGQAQRPQGRRRRFRAP
jgi:hypothetical protein